MGKKTRAKVKKGANKTEAVSEEPNWVECPECDGEGQIEVRWPVGIEIETCPRCEGRCEVPESSIKMVDCPECEGTGEDDDANWWPSFRGPEPARDPDQKPDPCMECNGTGQVSDALINKRKRDEIAEKRGLLVPTAEERDLSNSLQSLLEIEVDDADRLVNKILAAVRARKNYDDSTYDDW